MVKTEVATNTPHLSLSLLVGQKDGTQITRALGVYLIYLSYIALLVVHICASISGYSDNL